MKASNENDQNLKENCYWILAVSVVIGIVAFGLIGSVIHAAVVTLAGTLIYGFMLLVFRSGFVIEGGIAIAIWTFLYGLICLIYSR